MESVGGVTTEGSLFKIRKYSKPLLYQNSMIFQIQEYGQSHHSITNFFIFLSNKCSTTKKRDLLDIKILIIIIYKRKLYQINKKKENQKSQKIHKKMPLILLIELKKLKKLNNNNPNQVHNRPQVIICKSRVLLIKQINNLQNKLLDSGNKTKNLMHKFISVRKSEEIHN